MLIHFCCEANHFPDCAEGSEEKNGNITGKTASAGCVGAGIVECLKGWRCMVGGVECVGRVEVCGKGGGVWEGWCVVGGVMCVVGGMVCG